MTALPHTQAPAPWLRLTALNFFVYGPIGVQIAFLPLWLDSRGLSAPQISFVMAMPALAGMVAPPLIGRIADRTGRTAWTLALTTLAAVAGFAALTQAQGFAAIALVFAFCALARAPTTSLCDALIVHATRRHPGLDYSRVRMGGSAAVLLVMLSGGWMIGFLPADGIVWLSLAFISIAAASAFHEALTTPGEGHRESGPAHGSALVRPKLVAAVVAAVALTQASHAVYYVFGSLQWRAGGFSSTFIGAAFALGVAAEILFFWFSRRMVGGESRAAAYLMAGAAGAMLRWAIMATGPTNPGIILALQCLHALSFGATHLGGIYLMVHLVPDRYRAQAQGWLSATQSLTSAGLTFASGPLYAALGPGAYLPMAGIAGAGLVIAMLVGRRI